MTYILYRVRDPNTGLFWNNDLHAPKFVEVSEAPSWRSMETAQRRAAQYANRRAAGNTGRRVNWGMHYHFASDHDLYDGLPPRVEVASYEVEETFVTAITQEPEEKFIYLERATRIFKDVDIIFYMAVLMSKKNHKSYRYLARHHKSQWWDLEDVLAKLPSRKSFLILSEDCLALRDASEVFVLKSALPEGFVIDILDIGAVFS